MKKIISTVALIGTLLPALVFAATDVTLTASANSVAPGNTFTVVVKLNSTEPTYTTKVSVSFPADVLEVTGFTLAPSWLGLTQPGYDLVDNVNGKIIKTGGYPNGLTSGGNFGTITFRAKTTGTASIKVNTETQVLNKSNGNTFSGTQNSAEVAVRTVTVSTPATTAELIGQAAENNTATTEVTSTTTSSVSATSTLTGSNQAAAVVTSGARSKITIYGLIALAAILIAGGAWYGMKGRRGAK